MSASKGTVLIVEDEGAARELLAELLSSEGYDVLEARDGKAALERLQDPSAHVDVIVLDLVMPRMDGWEFRRRQKNDERLAEIPVIVATAVGSTPRIEADLILHKPIEMSMLLRAISHFT